MNLLGRQKLVALRNENPKVNNWIRSWAAEISSNRCHWGDENCLYQQFPNAQKITSGIFHFAVSNSKIVLETKISFPQKVVLIEGVKRC